MGARGIVMVVLALIFAGGAAFLARAWMSAQTVQVAAAPAPPPTQAVLVARDPLAMGQLLKPENLAWQSWPDGPLNPGYIVQGTKNPADFAGFVVRQPFGKGEPITEDRVVAPGDRGFLSAVLRPGMRAVAIGVDATSGIAGFVFPGDMVDILLTHTLPPEGPNQPGHQVSETILRDVRVIAIDQTVASKPGEPAVAHTVTIEVTPKQSEIVGVATVMGRLSLSLRSLGRGDDEAADPTAPIVPIADRTHQTFTLDTEASRLMGSSGRIAGLHVTVLHGGQSENVEFGVHK